MENKQTYRTLIETKDVDVNFRDKFDSTPLYYACLCGHMEVVRFLLEHGMNDVSIEIEQNYQ